MNKIKSVLLISLLLSVSILLVVNNDFNVEATGGGGEGEDEENSIGLDFGYMWNITVKLANVVHNYPPGVIPKGRDFGSWGDQWTADYLFWEMEYNLTTLENVEQIKIEKIDGKPLWLYNYTVDSKDFKITINGENYPYPEHTIPKSEMFVKPTGARNLIPGLGLSGINYNHTFTNLKVVPKNLKEKLEPTMNVLNITYENLTEYAVTIGNTTYIPMEGSIPQNQEFQIFILEEENGVNEQLENITSNISSVILLHNNTIGAYEANTSSCNASVITRVLKSDNNITTILNLLENNTILIGDNFGTNDTFTFTYNHNFSNITWFTNDFFYLTPDGPEQYDIPGTNFYNILIYNIKSWLNNGPLCRGIISYDIFDDTHLMWPTIRNWMGWENNTLEQLKWLTVEKGPLLQLISINGSIGRWLENHSDEPTTSITGYAHQMEKYANGYNIIGNITIDNSPNDNITIISNRYDSWWGECPGDSGAGAGITLGIAKYFLDYDIKPKYNLTFLMTTGEEWGYRGAWHYSHSHPEEQYNINRFIGIDQLGFETDDPLINFGMTDCTITGAIIENITKQAGYDKRTNNGFVKDANVDGTDGYAFENRDEYCDVIILEKEDVDTWLGHHRSGMNYNEGDSLKYINQSDLNFFFELAWNVTKYFCVNPDCWTLPYIGFNIIDSDDEDNLNDTVIVSHDVKSTLPHDKIWMNSSLISVDSGNIVMYNNQSFIANRTEKTKNISYTLPPNEKPGYYYIKTEFYNSTGIINEILYTEEDNTNETFYIGQFFLYPYNISDITPNITNISISPDIVGFGGDIAFSADVTSNVSDIDRVTVNISFPSSGGIGESKPDCYNMTNSGGDTYEYIFNDTWKNGEYKYTIWAKDINGNQSGSDQYSFNVSANANINVCTVQDEYDFDTVVNLTDPPICPKTMGYQLLDNNRVFHIWNRFDSYYFNTSSGIQLTNHFDNFWSRNVLMLGYYNNDVWNLIYRVDELSGFNKNIVADNSSFINITLWKDLTYEGYDFRLAVRYHLGIDDTELSVIPYIKNLGDEDIPYVLGFAWEIKDIQICMTPENDYIEINNSVYDLSDTLDFTFTNLDESWFCINEDISESSSESLYLSWDNSLDYKVQVKSKTGEYNAPVTLGIKIGILPVGVEKSTCLFWHDASIVTFYFDHYDYSIPGERWTYNPGYMTDGNESSYAITSSNGDVELCDGNSFESNSGVISKVELRACGYYSGSSSTIFIRPVFDGVSDGSDNEFVTSAESSWSSWFDITCDKGAPESWGWNDIEELDCDIESFFSHPESTLFCSRVEIRVAYSTGAPEVSYPSPSDGSMNISICPMLGISVNDSEGDSMNISWLSNSSGGWQVFGSNFSIVNGTYHQMMCNASLNGLWYYWKVNVSDGFGYTESDVYKFYCGFYSRIKNTGSTNISGYLLIQVQYYSGDCWVVVGDTINETSPRSILAGSELGLDTIFNGNVRIGDLCHETGSYRIYAAFRNPNGDVLVCDDESLLEDTYEFTVS